MIIREAQLPRLDEEPGEWLGDGSGDYGVCEAVANSLLFTLGIRMTPEALDGFRNAMPPGMNLDASLRWTTRGVRDYCGTRYSISDMSPVAISRHWRPAGMIVTYWGGKGVGQRASLSLSGLRIVSCGEVVTRREPIEDSWMLDWRILEA